MTKPQEFVERTGPEPNTQPVTDELRTVELDKVTGGLVRFSGVDGESTHVDHKGEI